MRKLACALCALAFLCLFVGGALLGFEQITLDSAVYDRLHEELNVYEYVGLSRDALPRVTSVLAEYLRGQRDNIDIEESLFGLPSQVFNADEKAHMVDVVNLFRLERTIRTGSLTAGLILLALSALLARNRLTSLSLRALGLALGFLLILVALVCTLWMTSGFNRLFILFHQLLFTNDLWLMDPATDAMIRMFPAEFFLRISLMAAQNALALGIAFPAAAQLVLLAAAFIQNHSGRRQTS